MLDSDYDNLLERYNALEAKHEALALKVAFLMGASEGFKTILDSHTTILEMTTQLLDRITNPKLKS